MIYEKYIKIIGTISDCAPESRIRENVLVKFD